MGPVGGLGYPLPVHRFLDDGISKQPKLQRCAGSPRKPVRPVQLLPAVHSASGAVEEQQVA